MRRETDRGRTLNDVHKKKKKKPTEGTRRNYLCKEWIGKRERERVSENRGEDSVGSGKHSCSEDIAMILGRITIIY